MKAIAAMLAACVGLGAGAGEGAGAIPCWAVDPLVKVFRDAAPAPGAEAVAEVARGEHASIQVVVRGEAVLEGLRAEASALRLEGGQTALEARVRFVGYVPVERPTHAPSSDQLRVPPAMYPDPLLENSAIDVAAGEAQPIWLTIPVGVDAAPGTYTGELRISAQVAGKAFETLCPLRVVVHPAVIKSTRLWVTEWFSTSAKGLPAAPEPDSDQFYDLLRRIARSMAAHRHNVALISPSGLAEFTVGADGALAIDWSRFDRWVAIFKEEGVIGRIEGGHIGGRQGGWESEFVVGVRQIKDGQAVASNVDPSSAEADAFYAVFFPALVAHLKEKGWLDIYMQHLADEPIASNVDSYRAMAALLQKHAPELRIVEACHTKELTGAMHIWVPQLNYLQQDFAHYQERQAAGEEIWFYTCVYPQGEYANRFLEQPLIKTRLLHWINFRYGVTGYLHWGYNQWRNEDPFVETTPPHGGPPYLPAGDAWIVYPGPDGPLDSIRFEAMRDGIEDHELLSLLAEKDADAANRLVNAHILDFDRYNTEIEAFRATRRELLRLVSAAQSH